jgi:uncharacterized membrane protein HdeD (DUF308 family)
MRVPRFNSREQENVMAERISRPAMDAGIADTERQVRDALDRAQAQIADHWVWYLILGFVLLLAGFAAIAFPYLSTMAAKIALGWIFLVAGVATILHAFSAGAWRGFFLNLLIGLLYLVAGAYLAFLPLTGIITLTIVIAALFLTDGVLEVIMAFRVRPHEGWVWVLISGLAAIAVGAMIAMQLPNSAAWAIGLLVGIKLIFAGWSFISLALGAHRWADAHAHYRPV